MGWTGRAPAKPASILVGGNQEEGKCQKSAPGAVHDRIPRVAGHVNDLDAGPAFSALVSGTHPTSAVLSDAMYIASKASKAADCGRDLPFAAAASRLRPHVAFVAFGVTGESDS